MFGLFGLFSKKCSFDSAHLGAGMLSPKLSSGGIGECPAGLEALLAKPGENTVQNRNSSQLNIKIC